MNTAPQATGFESLGVDSRLTALLRRVRIDTPTPIQQEAIPAALKGHDVIGIAETGTGKTLAFGIPMIQRLKPTEFGLIIAPTRELAQQIAENLQTLRVEAALVVGGLSMSAQKNALRSRPEVVVATPGRLIDHLNQGNVKLHRAGVVVLDEADRMLDMGFLPPIRRILSETPKSRQTMLFSATMPSEIEALVGEFMVDAQRIEVSRPGSASRLVRQELIWVSHEEKGEALEEVVQAQSGPVLVFSRTRHGARKLARRLRLAGHKAAEIHSDRTQAQRREALAGFKSGQYRVLVATDIAARGIDVKEVALVVNYDVPEHADDYVHRIGRTGRAGAEGRAVTFAMPSQKQEVRDIEKLMGEEIMSAKRGGAPLPKPSTPKPAVPAKPREERSAPAPRPAAERTEMPAPARQSDAPAQAPMRPRRAPKAKAKPTRATAPQPAAPPRKGHRGWSGRPYRKSDA